MLPLIVSLLVVAAAAAGQDCDNSSCKKGIFRYYRELHCLPIHEDGSCCPTRFDCSHLSNRPSNQCHVRGASYNIQDRVPTEQLHYSCVADCYCDGNDDNSRANLRCANIECPETLGVPAPPGCQYTHSHDKCCSIGTVCTNETTPELFKCQHDDHSHHLGEKFFPDDTCLKCICQQEYDGTLKETWCKEIDCGLDIHYGDKIQDGCVPVYVNGSPCCPLGWRCPKDSDTVEGTSDAASAQDSHQCVFGKLHLQLNQKLNSEKSCEECKCSVPPHVSCTRTSYDC